MTHINDVERGLGQNSRATHRGAGSVVGGTNALQLDAGVGTGPRYWSPESGIYRVVLNGYKFDFHPRGDGKRGGTVEGRVMANGHDGGYEILRNDSGDFQMKVRIGTPEAPAADMNATLFIVGYEARVEGTLQGKSADPKATAKVAHESGRSFKVEFSGADLVWYPRD
jgi:hypothetical protein